jgi:hypothetical protein
MGGFTTPTSAQPTYIIGDDVLCYNPHAYVPSSSWLYPTFGKVLTITLTKLSPSPSTLRIKFSIQGSSTGGSGTTYARIYKNGSAYGSIVSKTDTGFSEISQDLSFSQNDTIELWLSWKDNLNSNENMVKNFRICALSPSFSISATEP